MSAAAAIALHRFGLGARADEPWPDLSPDGLLAQLPHYRPDAPAWQPAARTPAALADWLAQQRAVRQAQEAQRAGIREAYLREARQTYLTAVGARFGSALQSSTPFVERLVHFWSNHFAVSIDKTPVVGLAGAFEADAIRPHVLGRFEDLLAAAVAHPAMLLFLDQAQSIGPGSRFGRRVAERTQRPRGLNENLAREILELHTLGVRGGYTQDDVMELARALTGWTLPADGTADGGSAALAESPAQPPVQPPAEPSADPRSEGAPSPRPFPATFPTTFPTTFRFAPALHEPGARQLLGRTYPEGGVQQARDILRDLASSPATARHLAFKLARHFVADEPPPTLVRRLADVYQQSAGDLPAVYRELVRAPEAWSAPATKFKSPFEWTVSALRALGRREVPPLQAAALMNQLGQPVWRPGSPAGYDDTSATWSAPDALLRRVEVAQRLALQAGGAVDARSLAPLVLPGRLGRETVQALARAESGTTALALLLVSPEFLRR